VIPALLVQSPKLTLPFCMFAVACERMPSIYELPMRRECCGFDRGWFLPQPLKGFYPSGGGEMADAIETAVKINTPGVVQTEGRRMVPVSARLRANSLDAVMAAALGWSGPRPGSSPNTSPPAAWCRC
jgi:hypothetical protein